MSMSAIEVSTCKDVEIINIESGLDFILSHFKPPHFPRRISTFVTALTGEWQTIVNSREEALRLCKESNNIDCRISAYPYPVPISKDGVNMQTTDFFLTDIDMKDFKTKKAFEQCLNKTLQNFNDKLHEAKPTILWTGGGYHALMPMNADIVLETERRIFSKFADLEPSRRLMHYAEKLVTDNKGDQRHRDSVSFGNCMVRIPWSYDSKYVQKNDKNEIISLPLQSQVKILHRWDGYGPNIR